MFKCKRQEQWFLTVFFIAILALHSSTFASGRFSNKNSSTESPPPSPPAGETEQVESNGETELPPFPKKAKTGAGPSHSPVRDEDDHTPPTASPQGSTTQQVALNIQQVITTAGTPGTPTGEEFIPLSKSYDSPQAARPATTKSRSASPVQESTRSELIEPPSSRPMFMRTYSHSPLHTAASQQVEAASEQETYEQYGYDKTQEDESIIELDEQGLRRLVFRTFCPDAFQNIVAAIIATDDPTSINVQPIIDNHAKLPLQKTATLFKILNNYSKQYPFGASITKGAHLPIRALALIINTILIATDDVSLLGITDSIKEEFDVTATLIANPNSSPADPVPEADLENAVRTLEKKLLRSGESEPYKLPLTEKGVTLINVQINWNKTVLYEIREFADLEEFQHIEIQRLVETAMENNVVYAVNEDNSSQSKSIGQPGHEVTYDSLLIKEHQKEGLTHCQVTTLPFQLASPALTYLLSSIAEQMNSTNAIWENLAKFILEGVRISMPFAIKNDETFQVLAQTLYLLASLPPPVIQASDLTITNESELPSLTKTLSDGGQTTVNLLSKEILPETYELDAKYQDNEGETEENFNVTLTPSNPAVQDKLADIEKEILQELDPVFHELFESVLYYIQDQGGEEDEYDDQQSSPLGHTEGMPKGSLKNESEDSEDS